MAGGSGEGRSEFWSGIWLTRWKAAGVGVVLSALIASILYAFNWHSFYDTRRNFVRADAAQISQDVALLADSHGAGADEALQRALVRYLDGRSARVSVWRGEREAPRWRVSNDAFVDRGRTLLVEHFELASADGQPLHVEVEEGIRPPLWTALGRAWSFSLADYLDDPAHWSNAHLVNRSKPLYGYLFTILLVGFGTIRAFHRDQVQLTGLQRKAHGIADELDALRERHRSETAELRDAVAQTEGQRDAALRERERLYSEIEAVEQEYGEVEGAESVASSVRDERLRGIAERKAMIERELSTHDQKVGFYEGELSRVRGELEAADDLLSEVESRHDDLTGKLRDRNRQIRKLQELVQEAQQDAHDLELESAKIGGKAASDSSLGEIERQLQPWLKTGKAAQVNFSTHSRTGKIETALAKLDRDFVDRHFTHVFNPEYERGARRLIRVIGDERHGELVVVLDDDAGRTLGLRYDLRDDAPEATHVGFVLALLLRARSRGLRGFEIRTR